MSVYLSGRFERRDELNRYKAELEAIGVLVTSRWLTNDLPVRIDELTEDHWRELALVDIEDVRHADAFVLCSEATRGGGGGRQAEFGMAVAWSKLVIIVGRREHIFHRLPEVQVVEDWKAAFDMIKARSRWRSHTGCPFQESLSRPARPVRVAARKRAGVAENGGPDDGSAPSLVDA